MNKVRDSFPDIDLPEGWIWCKLGEVADAQPGFACGKKDVQDGLIHLRMNNIGDDCCLNMNLIRRVPLEYRVEKYLLKKGDFLFCHTNSSKLVGKNAIFDLDGEYAYSNHLTRLRINRLATSAQWLWCILTVYWKEGQFEKECKHWVNQSTLPQDKLVQFTISLPPLPEQNFIVTRVEALLEQVRRAKAELNKVPQIMKRFRQAVLKKAFSGELTADWRVQQQNFEPATELLNHIQEERIRRYEDEVKQAKAEGRRPPKKPKYLETEPLDTSDLPELPEGWAWIKLGQVIRTSDERVNPNELSNELYIGLEHMESNTTKIIALGQAYEVRSTKTRFRKGDILYGKLRPYLNKACIPDFDGVCSTDILVFQCMPRIVNAYLLRFLTTREFVAYSNQNMSGIQLPRVSFDKLAVFPIPLPPLSEQSEIVRRVEALFKLADEVEKRVEETKKRVEKITLSILSKAFRGELSADFREAVKNWKSLDLEARKKYIFTLPEEEQEKALYADEFPLESAEQLLKRIQEEWAKREQDRKDRKSSKTKKNKTSS